MIVQQVQSVLAHKEDGSYGWLYGVRHQEMDAAKHMSFVIRIFRTNVIIGAFLATSFSFCLVGCSDQAILPSANQLMEFKNTAPLGPAVDIGHLVKVKTGELTYRVAPGEVLELTMPAIFQAVSDDETDGAQNLMPFICRVSEMGTINLPLVGNIGVAGKTLAQTESAVMNAYYPRHAVIRPSVYARVLEYKVAKISVSGAVRNPGIYSLRSDEMSLFTLLMKAGGIVDEGADLIRVHRDDEDAATDRRILPRQLPKGQEQEILTANVGGWSRMPSEPARRAYNAPNRKNATANKNVYSKAALDTFCPKQEQTANKTIHLALLGIPDLLQGQTIREKAKSGKRESPKDLVVPVRGLNIPSVDIVLRDGDSVVVERRKVLLFTVLGLVNAPGSFPYPANINYSLMQAIGLAGGLNQVAEPRYATVYRLRPDGTIISAIFQVVNTGNGSMLTDALNIRLKPGDIVTIEHTPRTRTKVFLDGIFRLNFGAYYRLEEAWSE